MRLHGIISKSTLYHEMHQTEPDREHNNNTVGTLMFYVKYPHSVYMLEVVLRPTLKLILVIRIMRKRRKKLQQDIFYFSVYCCKLRQT